MTNGDLHRIFWINLPFCAIGLVLVPIYLRLNQRVESMANKLRRIDYVGTVVFVASVTAVLVPLSWGGVMYDWDHWRTLVPLLVGVAGLFVFVFWEIYGATEPMIRLTVFQNRTAISSYAGTVFHGIIVCHPLLSSPSLLTQSALERPLLPSALLRSGEGLYSHHGR